MHVAALGLAWLASSASVLAAARDGDWLLRQGLALRSSGQLDAAVAVLEQAHLGAATTDAAQRSRIALGAVYLQQRRLDAADNALSAAYRESTGTTRAAAALERGNLALARKQHDQAGTFYREVLRLADSNSPDALAARINLIRLDPPALRVQAAASASSGLESVADTDARAALLLNLGHLLAEAGPAGAPAALAAYEQARQLVSPAPASRLHLSALSALAALHESQGRWDEVVALGAAAQDASAAHPVRHLQDLLLEIEWRQGRAYRQAGRNDLALAAMLRATEHAQAIRADMPIEAPDGRSTYEVVLQPLLELAIELQLDATDAMPPARRTAALGRVRDLVESMRQAEVQDFLGDRCTVDEGGLAQLEPGAVAIYPILLPERVELLAQTRDGLKRVSRAVPRSSVMATARALARALRSGHPGYLASAQRLYDWLVRPLEDELAGMHTLVVVPDGVLRLVPFAALHDGRAPLLERLAVTTVTGMSMTDGARPSGARRTALLAGLAEPGPVVEHIAATGILRAASGFGIADAQGAADETRAIRSAARALSRSEADEIRSLLVLPGVRQEVAAIAETLGGRVLLDRSFTLKGFEAEAEGGDYRIVHIASHGVFGGTAESSFILAYDELLGINQLQSVLRSDKVQQDPIELLTLSACETAEGNDRAPLGIAGAAVRARAKSVLGTLWAVDDEATRQVMERFYQGLVGGQQSKAAALRDAQLGVLRQRKTSHPVYWAPFNLVGNWK